MTLQRGVKPTGFSKLDSSFIQITPSKETMLAWQNRPQKLVAQYIKRSLSNAPQLQNGNASPKVNM